MTAVLIIMAVIFLWGMVSARLERADLTAPSAPEALRPLVEFTLVWVLFSDAAGVPYRDLRSDAGMYLRLLGVGAVTGVAVGLAGGVLLNRARGRGCAGGARLRADTVALLHRSMPVRGRLQSSVVPVRGFHGQYAGGVRGR